jgi:tetratricopeptide (TPR) repeat protein
LHGQAGLAFRAGDYLEALEPLDECIAISQEIGQTEFLGNHYASQSLVYYALGDYDRADACVDLALQTYDSIAKYSHIADALCDKTRICVKAGRLECAVGLLLKALANYQPTEERHFLSLPLAAGNIFIAAHRQADAAVMFYALQHHIRQKGIVLSLCDQTELEEGLSQVASLPPDVLARAKARGEALSPEELADHALKALRDLQQELDGESFEEVSADRPPEDKTEEAAKHDAGRDAHA